MKRIEIIAKMLTESPEDIFLNYALAMEYLSENNLEKTIETFENIKIKDPNYLPVYYQLAKCYESIQNNENAILNYEKGIEIAEKQNEKKTGLELKSALEELIF